MGESKAEQLVGLAEAVSIVAIFPSFMLVVWAIWQRPPWRAIRDTIYFLLCGLGLTYALFAFFVLFRPNMGGVILGIGVACLLAYLAAEKFEQL